MTWQSFYEELKGWQQGIAAILGFLALMAAALWNFRLNRRRDAHLRSEETSSIAAAIYGEIILLRKEAAQMARIVARRYADGASDLDKHFLEAHKFSEPTLYRALASKIGMLSPDLILAITEFHQHFQDARNGLPLLVASKDRPYVYSPLSFLRDVRDAVTGILPALRTIERLIAVTNPVDEELDLGMTDDVIENEEELMNAP